MNSVDKFKTPTGEIGMYLHKGGVWLPEENRLSDDAIILKSVNFKNLIVNKASELMAGRMAPGSTPGNGVTPGNLTGNFFASGFQYLAVGTGGTGWDLQNPPAPTLTATKLQNEIFRKQFTDWTFLKSDGTRSSTATNILQLVTTFNENEAVGALVEMGLFGANATSTKDSGYMFNYKTFAVWNKPNDSKLTVTWKITF